MELTIATATLKQGVGQVQRAVASRSTLPVLGLIRMVVTESEVRLTGSDLDLTIEWTGSPDLVKMPGELCIPGRLLAEYLGLLPDGTVDLKAKGTELHVKAGDRTAVFQGMPPAEFPPPPVWKSPAAFTVPASVLARGAEEAGFAVSGDPSSPVLAGVSLAASHDTLVFAATDRHRLAEAQVAIAGVGPKKDIKVIVPGSHLQIAVRLMGASSDVAIKIDQQHVAFARPGLTVTSRLIAGVFPNYQQVIPVETSTSVIVSRADLQRELALASVVTASGAGTHPIEVIVAKSGVTLRGDASEIGQTTGAVTGTLTGVAETTYANGRYLLDAVNAVSDEQVELAFNGPQQPISVRPVGRQDFVALVMPVSVPKVVSRAA